LTPNISVGRHLRFAPLLPEKTAVRSIGAFEPIRVLGEGGMGTVYLARDRRIGRLVAVKLMRAGTDSPTVRARLLSEARAAGRLSHPNIVTIYHVDEHDDCPYIVMEYIEGQSLAAVIRERLSLATAQKLLILERICAGLACAHDAGLVHRDVKPANCMVDAALVPKLLDFGLAKLPDARHALTGEHDVVGTISYMSPEQLTNGSVDQRSDLFAVAAMAYELVTLRRAFTGDTQQVISQILHGSPRTHSDDSAAAPIAALLRKGLERDPTQRFQTAREMGLAFQAAREQCGEDLSDRSMAAVANPPSSQGTAHDSVHWRTRTAFAFGAATVSLLGIIAVYNGIGGAAEPDPSAARPTAVSVTPTAAQERAVVTPPHLTTKETKKPLRSPSSTLPLSVELAQAPTQEVPASNVAPNPSVPIGSLLMVQIGVTLDSRRSGPGQTFEGAVADPLLIDGREVITAGARVEGRVERTGLDGGARPFIELSLTALTIAQRLVPIRTGLYRAIAPQVDRGPNFAAIVIGGVAGGAAGGILGGPKGAGVGAAIGVVSGASLREGTQTEYYLGSRLPFRIAEPIYVEATP
jgi:eukaryotic-like serine/threonine-protein kinase